MSNMFQSPDVKKQLQQAVVSVIMQLVQGGQQGGGQQGGG
jgi:hypothetical protein